MKKLELADTEIPEERRAVLYGPRDAEFLLFGWGFVKGAAIEAVERLKDKGINGAYLHLRFFSPFPSKLTKKVIQEIGVEKTIAVEHSYRSQAAQTLALNTGITLSKSILKYTGRPIYAHELIQAVEKILGEKRERVVLTYGA